MNDVCPGFHKNRHDSTPSTATTEEVNNYILCGRGKIHSKHSGNIKFSNLIQTISSDYARSNTRTEKILVVASAADFIRDAGMKFMECDVAKGRYIELSSERIHDKVSHAIRDHLKVQKHRREKESRIRKRLQFMKGPMPAIRRPSDYIKQHRTEMEGLRRFELTNATNQDLMLSTALQRSKRTFDDPPTILPEKNAHPAMPSPLPAQDRTPAAAGAWKRFSRPPPGAADPTMAGRRPATPAIPAALFEMGEGVGSLDVVASFDASGGPRRAGTAREHPLPVDDVPIPFDANDMQKICAMLQEHEEDEEDLFGPELYEELGITTF